MTVALPSNTNHPKLAQKSSSSKNYSSPNSKPILSDSTLEVEQRGENMIIRVSTARVSSSQFSSSSTSDSMGANNHHHRFQYNPNQNNSHHNPQIVIPKRTWALGTMLMFVLFVLSSSTSSVACVPLGSSSSSSISSRLELTSNPLEERGQVGRQSGPTGIEEIGGNEELIRPQEQIYWPSLLQQTSGLGHVEQDEESEGGQARYGQQQQQLQEQARFASNPLRQHQKIPQNEDDSSREGWETVIDPRLYLLTEWDSNTEQQQRMRRNVGPSLSIVNPLDVLRQRLLLEIARRKMRQSHNQIIANAEILKSIGRRRRR